MDLRRFGPIVPLFTSAPPPSGGSIPRHVLQENANWCWACCLEMVSSFQLPAAIDKCMFATRHFFLEPGLANHNCCDARYEGYCDVRVTFQQVTNLLDSFGIDYVAHPGRVSFDQIVSFIDAGKLVFTAWYTSLRDDSGDWNQESGHCAIIIRYTEPRSIVFHDPIEFDVVTVIYEDYWPASAHRADIRFEFHNWIVNGT